MPGPLGIIAPMFVNLYKASESESEQLMLLTAGQAVAMALQLGDPYYILKMKSQAVKDVFSSVGNEETFKALKHENPSAYKDYVDEVREAGVSDAIMHHMAWKEGETGYYIPAKDAEKFKKEYDKQYAEQYKMLKQLDPSMSEEKLKRSATATAAMFAQYSLTPVEIPIPQK